MFDASVCVFNNILYAWCSGAATDPDEDFSGESHHHHTMEISTEVSGITFTIITIFVLNDDFKKKVYVLLFRLCLLIKKKR